MTSSVRDGIVSLVARHAPSDHSHACRLPGVTFKRISHTITRVPVFYEPCAVFVVQGRKRAFLADAVFHYDSGHYLLLGSPLPLIADARATAACPMLAVYVRLKREVVGELLGHLPGLDEPPHDACPLQSIPLDEKVADALHRLLHCLEDPFDTDVLGSQYVRELIYLILRGPGGASLRSTMGLTTQHTRISQVIRTLHERLSESWPVPRLGKLAGMSSSVFHLQFKSVTGTTPTQYLKALRLHRARTIMLDEKQTVGEAAGRVGYKSLAQFSRDYKRLFRHVPSHTDSQSRSEPMLS